MNRHHTISLRLLALVLALGAAGLSGCQKSESAPAVAAKATEVGVVTVQAQPFTLSTELAGRTTAYKVAQIRPQVGGIVQQRAFVEGGQVKAGDVLYQLDAASYRASFASAEASVERAEATLQAAQLKAKRQSELLAIQAISQQDHEDAQASLKQAQADLASAKAALDTARINLERTRITSPIAGRAEVSTVTQGALVTANQETALTTVQQLDPIYVDIPQSSVQLLQLKQALASGQLKQAGKEGVQIQLVLEDGSAYPHAGQLQFSGVSVNTGTGAVTLRALVPNPEHLLLPGMYVRAQINQAKDPDALLVPQQALSRDGSGRASVWVVAQDGKAEQRAVTTAEAVGQSWRVTSGLKAGERIIIEGAGKVRSGQIVHAVNASQPAVQTASAVTMAAR